MSKPPNSHTPTKTQLHSAHQMRTYTSTITRKYERHKGTRQVISRCQCPIIRPTTSTHLEHSTTGSCLLLFHEEANAAPKSKATALNAYGTTHEPTPPEAHNAHQLQSLGNTNDTNRARITTQKQGKRTVQQCILSHTPDANQYDTSTITRGHYYGGP